MKSIIEIGNLAKGFKGKEVLTNINLQVYPGEILGLLGSNGAGKTTLLKIIAGLIKQDRGQVLIKNLPNLSHALSLRKELSYIMQDNNLQREFTVEEELKTFAPFYGIPSSTVDSIITKYNLKSYSQTKIQNLSGGMARKVQIIRGLMTKPSIILLDEPSVGLDPDVRRELWQLIKTLQQAGMAVILTTHYMEEAEFLCTKMAVLKQGKILVQGQKADLLNLARAQSNQPINTLEEAFLFLVKGVV